MHFNQLGAVAALATLSQGFLLPPHISAEDTDIINALPFEDAVGIDGRIIEINCPDCPVLTNLAGKLQAVQTESILQLNFSTLHNHGADQLLLNGLPVYPLDPQAMISMEPLTASQMVKSMEGTWQYASKPEIGYSLSIKHPASTGQLNLLNVHLEIVEVAGKFITGIPTVDIRLLETPSGKMMILDSGIAVPASLSSPTDDDKQCTTLLCKWRAIVADRLTALKKGCGSKRPRPDLRPEFVLTPHYTKHHGGHRRPHDGARRPFRHHHRHGSFTRFFQSIVLHILIPVLIGITVGVTASLVGMVVGHIAIFTWRLLFRRGQPKYTEIKQQESVEDDDVSEGLMEKQGPPPQYVVDDKKEHA